MSEERLQKVLARAGVASRRKAEELIRQGRVTVNGQTAGLGDKVDTDRDAIKVDGRRVQVQGGEQIYLLMNKPAGFMSTTADPEGRPTVVELVPPPLRKALVPVGRLDFHTEGLLLLTNDGDFAHRVSHPRYGCTKTYEVKVKGTPEKKGLDKLRAGIVLEGRRTAPCRIEASPPPPGPRSPEKNSWWKVELSEGRTRQIREMFFRIGHPVSRLRRVAIGPLTDPSLPPGAVRELTEAEVRKLLRSTRRSQRGARPQADGEKAGSEKAGKPRAKRGQPAGSQASGGRGAGGRPPRRKPSRSKRKEP